MISIMYLSVNGSVIGEHIYEDSDSLQEAKEFAKQQLSKSEIVAVNGREITVFKSEHVAGYRLYL